MAPPIALITGASSGIGLALTKHLLEKKWNVVIADVQPPKEELENSLFIPTDISSWDQQASTFKQAYEWNSRLDFVALNAGIDDRDDIFHSISKDPAKPPTRPNMRTIDVNLTGTYYGIKLAAHYLSLPSSKPTPGGKIIVTASAAGIYPLPVIPQYAASKHGLVGMVRSMASVARPHNITINAICPALVPTSLPPPGLLDHFSPDQLTPMATLIRAFTELADLDNVDKPDWVEDGKNGEVVECNIENLIYHPAPARPNGSRHLSAEGMRAWAETYVGRNRGFVEEGGGSNSS
ncbi:hypothetical protein PRZ48_001404 [Zasmidium cellare]|uniref:15-hydroxyprostaglandin dehydrogenase n=1 Tax=Zasmidium cellare TaxID=395010 RepID=A0ABR0F158_ZASCE|nr:hypothetical protein PRZ48_001404 [Zasmidium cellare]